MSVRCSCVEPVTSRNTIVLYTPLMHLAPVRPASPSQSPAPLAPHYNPHAPHHTRTRPALATAPAPFFVYGLATLAPKSVRVL